MSHDHIDISARAPRRLFVELIVNNILPLALAILALSFATRSGAFPTFSNIRVLLTNYAAIGVVAAAMAFLVIAGRADLPGGSSG